MPMRLSPGDIAQRGAVIGSLMLAVYAAVMTGQGWQDRLGRRKQAYQDQLEIDRVKSESALAGLTTLEKPTTPS